MILRHIHVVYVLPWGLSITEARYYGYRFGLHVGPLLVFVGYIG